MNTLRPGGRTGFGEQLIELAPPPPAGLADGRGSGMPGLSQQALLPIVDQPLHYVGVRTGLNLVALFARLAAPVMPTSAATIAATVGATDLSWPAADEAFLDQLPHGQKVAAVVSFREGQSASDEELTEFLRGSLANYKVPKTIVDVPEIRRSPAGKADYKWAKEQISSE